jgi:hypothetical protein
LPIPARPVKPVPNPTISMNNDHSGGGQQTILYDRRLSHVRRLQTFLGGLQSPGARKTAPSHRGCNPEKAASIFATHQRLLTNLCLRNCATHRPIGRFGHAEGEDRQGRRGSSGQCEKAELYPK